MSKAVVQINFPYDMPRDQLESHTAEAAPMFADIPGLIWKIWLVNEDQRITGGHYLFEDRKAAKAYLESPIVDKIRKDWPEAEIRLFETLDTPGRITRAP